jgi:hypothetical protein
MKRFDVTLLFSQGGAFGSQFFAESKSDAKAQAIVWAKQCGFVGAVKKADVIEVSGASKVSKAGGDG